MSGCLGGVGSHFRRCSHARLRHKGVLTVRVGLAWLMLLAGVAHAQQRREREPNTVYGERRAQLASELTAPLVLWGFTGREEISQSYIFEQEENFYYLSG